MSGPVFRVDKFDVPEPSLDEFLARIRRTHAELDTRSGCELNEVLVQTDGPGRFNVVTVVRWSSPEAMADARAHMQARYAAEGFDPAELMSRLEVTADLANYARAS